MKAGRKRASAAVVAVAVAVAVAAGGPGLQAHRAHRAVFQFRFSGEVVFFRMMPSCHSLRRLLGFPSLPVSGYRG